MMKNCLYGVEMARTVKLEKELFEAMLRKMITAKPVPLARIPKSKKNLPRMMEQVIPAPSDQRVARHPCPPH